MSDTEEFPRTWLWLLGQLQRLNIHQLNQPIQVLGPVSDYGKVALLMPAVSLGTVEQLLHVDGEVCLETRGPDFAHHPEQVILCLDDPPFDADGDRFFTQREDGTCVGDRTGKVVPGPL